MDGAKLHTAFICKPCLDSSLKLVSLFLVSFCAVWEIRMCMDHIQAPTQGRKLCCKGANKVRIGKGQGYGSEYGCSKLHILILKTRVCDRYGVHAVSMAIRTSRA